VNGPCGWNRPDQGESTGLVCWHAPDNCASRLRSVNARVGLGRVLNGRVRLADRYRTMPQQPETFGGSHAPASFPVSQWSAVPTLLSACALVATAYLLGAAWLSVPTLGVPVGLWLIVVAVGIFRLDALRVARRLAGVSSSNDPSASVWAIAGALCRGFEAVTRWTRPLRDRFDVLSGSGEKAASRLSAWHDRVAWPERPLRVGLAVGPEVADALRAAPGSSSVQWVHVSAGTWGGVSPLGACKSLALDAVLHGEPGEGLRVKTLERSGRDAAWHDWATPRPLTYASVFPFLVDPTHATLGIRSVATGPEAELVRAMIEAAAVLSRSSHRIGLADRLIGRRPTDGARVQPGEIARVDRAMLRLARVFEGTAERVDSMLARVCARVLSADLCAGAGRSWASAELWDLISRVGGDEAEIALREAASRFVLLQDSGGLAALARADASLRLRANPEQIDHTALLEWELEHGASSEQAIGRLAAGICLACATRDAHAIGCVRDDLLDDMRHSAWLVDREHDAPMVFDSPQST
jgi:hypothetical protein